MRLAVPTALFLLTLLSSTLAHASTEIEVLVARPAELTEAGSLRLTGEVSEAGVLDPDALPSPSGGTFARLSEAYLNCESDGIIDLSNTLQIGPGDLAGTIFPAPVNPSPYRVLQVRLGLADFGATYPASLRLEFYERNAAGGFDAGTGALVTIPTSPGTGTTYSLDVTALGIEASDDLLVLYGDDAPGAGGYMIPTADASSRCSNGDNVCSVVRVAGSSTLDIYGVPDAACAPENMRLYDLTAEVLVSEVWTEDPQALWDQSDYELLESGVRNSFESVRVPDPCFFCSKYYQDVAFNDVSFAEPVVITTITNYYAIPASGPFTGSITGRLQILPKLGPMPDSGQLIDFTGVIWGLPVTMTLVDEHYEVTTTGLTIGLDAGDYWIGFTPDYGGALYDSNVPKRSGDQLRTARTLGDPSVYHSPEFGFPIIVPKTFDAAMRIDGIVGSLPAPQLGLDPVTSTVEVEVDGTESVFLRVANVATNPAGFLNFSLSSDCSWVRFSQPSGSVPPGGFVSPSITFEPVGLLPGVYTCNVALSTNDPSATTTTLPFTVTVFVDCNGNGLPDSGEIATDPSLDCNLNGLLDTCETAGLTAYAELPLDVAARGISADGERVYVTTSDPVVVAFDLSNPSAPTPVGLGSVVGMPLHSVPVDDYLYVATYDAGLSVVSTAGVGGPPSYTTMPTVGQLTGLLNIVRPAAAGDHLYLPAQSNGFHVASIVDRANPVVVGSLATAAPVQGVVVFGGHAFVSASSDGLYVIDLSNPVAPGLVAQLDTPGDGQGIAALGSSHVLIADGSSLQVVDVSTPTTPSVVASVPDLTNARDVTVDGPIAYVATDAGLHAYDMSDPALPVLIDDAPTADVALQAAVLGDYVVAACNDFGLVVTNAISPDGDGDGVPDECTDAPALAIQPSETGFALGQGAQTTAELLLYNVAAAGSRNLDWNLSEIGCSWLSITPTSGSIPGGGVATVTVTLDATGVVPGLNECELLLTSNDFFSPFAGIPYSLNVFADCDGNGTPDAQDIAASPGLDCNGNGFLDSCEVAAMTPSGGRTQSGTSVHVSADGTHAFVTNRQAGRVDVLNVSDPGAPTLVGTASVPGEPLCSLPVEDVLYVGTVNGLSVLDISTLGPPPSVVTLSTIGSIGEAYGVEGLARRGDLLYAAGGENSLELFILDITDRVNPTIGGFFPEPVGPRDLVFSGDHAFIATLVAGLFVVDLTDPLNPFGVQQLPLSGGATGIALLGTDHVLVTDPSSLHVVDVTSPTSPTIVATVPSLNEARDVHLDGPIAYVATADGMLAYDLSSPTSPVLLGSGPAPSGANGAVVVQDRLVVAGGSYGAVVYNPMALDADANSFPDECGTPTSVPTPTPTSFALHSAVPNPFNPKTSIRFDLPSSATVSLTIHDVSGRRVRSLVRGTMAAGRHEVVWQGRDDDGRRVASGVYYYKIEAGAFVDSRRMTLLK